MASAAGQSLHWDQLERLGFSMRCEPRVGHAALLEVHDVIGCHVTVLEQSRRSPVARPPRQALRLKEWAQITLDHVFIGSRMNCDPSPARSRHSHFKYQKELTTSHHIHKFHIKQSNELHSSTCHQGYPCCYTSGIIYRPIHYGCSRIQGDLGCSGGVYAYVVFVCRETEGLF